MEGGRFQLHRPAAGDAGQDEAAVLPLPGEQVLPDETDGELGQGQGVGRLYAHQPAALGAPVQGGGVGGQRQAAAQHPRQGQRQGQEGQRSAQDQQEMGQVVLVDDLEQQRSGECEEVREAAVCHGGHRRRGGRTLESACVAMSMDRCAPGGDPAAGISRWAMASTQMCPTSSGTT